MSGCGFLTEDGLQSEFEQKKSAHPVVRKFGGTLKKELLTKNYLLTGYPHDGELLRRYISASAPLQFRV